MRIRRPAYSVCAVVLLMGAAIAAGSERATPSLPLSPRQAAAAAPEKTAGETFKNVQVLKDIPASKFMPTMFFIAASLGVGCDHCHVTSDNGPWPL
jgi:hypothetical protein